MLLHGAPHLLSSPSSACHFVSDVFPCWIGFINWYCISPSATRFSSDSISAVVATSIGFPLWCDGSNGLVRTFVVVV